MALWNSMFVRRLLLPVYECTRFTVVYIYMAGEHHLSCDRLNHFSCSTCSSRGGGVLIYNNVITLCSINNIESNTILCKITTTIHCLLQVASADSFHDTEVKHAFDRWTTSDYEVGLRQNGIVCFHPMQSLWLGVRWKIHANSCIAWDMVTFSRR